MYHLKYIWGQAASGGVIVLKNDSEIETAEGALGEHAEKGLWGSIHWHSLVLKRWK